MKTKQEQKNEVDTNKISDGYHTFGELYEHRIALFIALCKAYTHSPRIVWRSKLHSDGTSWEGWFILGINVGKGSQITYHLPINNWKNTSFARTYDEAPEFDGHTPEDVIERLLKLK